MYYISASVCLFTVPGVKGFIKLTFTYLYPNPMFLLPVIFHHPH